jgi:hypothetical protein
MGVYDKVRHEIRWFLLHRLPTCERILPVLSQSLERRLGVRERIVVYFHLLVCVWCKWYLDQLRLLSAAAHERGSAERAEELSESVRLAEDARERIRRRVREAVGDAPE